MAPPDYREVLSLWRSSEGIGLSGTDSREGLTSFLGRNPGLSFVARRMDVIVGAVLCGHDGRRGYVYHLVVEEAERRRGIGKKLMEHCLEGLRRQGIDKCHCFVFAENQAALNFWRSLGWDERVDLCVMSRWTEREARGDAHADPPYAGEPPPAHGDARRR